MPSPKPLPDLSAAAVAPLGTVGDYLLLEELGEGGMGKIYRALHTKMDRLVAVKTLHPERLGDKRAVSLFKKEVKAAAKLEHPHIVRAYDAREIGDVYVLAMEYLEGRDLAEVVRQVGPLSIHDACEVVRQAALGLQCAHDKGLVHRDVKPSNLMLAESRESSVESGEPQASGGRQPTAASVPPGVHQPAAAGRSPVATIKLLDLGLARLPTNPASGESQTKQGMILGTPDYIAPEQVNDSHAVDIRADIYGLGCTFFCLLTGQPPFAGPDHAQVFQKLKAHVEQSPPDIRQRRPEVPRGVAKILSRMMAKQPEDRFPTPSEVAAALRPFTDGSDLGRLLAKVWRPGPQRDPEFGTAATRVAIDDDTRGAAAPPRPSQPPSARARVRRLWWAVAAVVVAVTLAGATWLIIRGIGSEIAGTDGGTPEISGGVTDDSASPPPEDSSRTQGTRTDGSSDWIVLSWSPTEVQRNGIWLFRPDGKDQRRVTGDAEMVDSEPVFSPDGRRLAFTRGDQNLKRSGIWVCDVSGRQIREVAAPAGPTERLMSPIWLDNQTVAFTRDPETNLLNDIEVRQLAVVSKPADVPVIQETELLFSFRDGFDGRGGLVTDVNPVTGQLAGLLQPAGQWDAGDIFVSDQAGKAWETVWTDDVDGRRDSRALWSPGGQRIAWQRQFTPGIQLRGMRTGVGLAELDDDDRWDSSLQPETATFTMPVAWTPDGKGLLCARIVGSPGRWPQAALFLVAPDFRIIRPLFELPGGLTIARQRHGGRLGDWALVPGDVPLPPATPPQ